MDRPGLDVAIENAGTAKWMVTSGLAANDQVVVSGQQKIKEGTPAKAVPWQPAAANGAKPQQAAAPAKAE